MIIIYFFLVVNITELTDKLLWKPVILQQTTGCSQNQSDIRKCIQEEKQNSWMQDLLNMVLWSAFSLPSQRDAI